MSAQPGRALWTAALLSLVGLAIPALAGTGLISVLCAASLLLVALFVCGFARASSNRMRFAARIGIVVSALPAMVLVTIFALIEQGETVLLRTFDGSGAPEETRLWVVDFDGSPWVGAGGGETRSWYRRLRAIPRVELVRNDIVRCVTAEPDFDPAVRDAVIELTRQKYKLGNAGLSIGNGLGIPMRMESVAIPVRLTPCENGLP